MRRQAVTAGSTISVLIGSTLLSACSGGSSSTTPRPCVQSFVYSDVQAVGDGFDVIDQESDTNAGNKSVKYTFTTQHSRTVSVQESTFNSFSVQAKVTDTGLQTDPVSTTPISVLESQAVFNYVHQTDSSVQQESTIQAGETVTMTIPPGATGYVLYGVIVKVTRGILRAKGCGAAIPDGPNTILVPVSYHSCNWTRGPDVFTAGGQLPSSCGIIVASNSTQ